jgi:RHS repeat-associated protein
MTNKKGTTTLSSFALTLDPAGNPLTSVRAGASAETATFTYDNLDRLTGVCFKTSCPLTNDPYIRWTYDAVGNRLTEVRPTGTKVYTYNAADQLTRAGTTTYTYDQNGNQKTAGSATFAYDLANRLVSTTSGNTTTTYGYDGLGRRLRAATGTTAAKTTKYLWDTAGDRPQIALERDGADKLLRRYVYGAARISMNTGTTPFYYHYDPLGSVANLTSSTGASQWTYAYEPYGVTRTETKNNTKAPANFMKFTAEYLDPTGLYHLRARQYDAANGRFLTLDPLPRPRSATYTASYVYAEDQPTLLIDPNGLGAIGNKCGSIWCWVKSREGQKAIGCGLFVGGGVALAAPALAIGVSATRGAAAAWETALAVENAETTAAGAVVGGSALSRGFPCL